MITWLIILSSLLGPVLVIAPTFERVERWLTDAERIDALQEVRRQFLQFERVTTADHGFEQALDVFRTHSPGQNWEDVLGFHSLSFAAFGGGGLIFLLDEHDLGVKNPINDGSADQLESVLITDRWLQDEIDQLRTQPKQTVRAIGLGLLVLSIILQALVTSSIIAV